MLPVHGPLLETRRVAREGGGVECGAVEGDGGGEEEEVHEQEQGGGVVA